MGELQQFFNESCRGSWCNYRIKGHDVICHHQGVVTDEIMRNTKLRICIQVTVALGNIVSFKSIIWRNNVSRQRHYLKEYCTSFCILREQCKWDLIQTQLFQLSCEKQGLFYDNIL